MAGVGLPAVAGDPWPPRLVEPAWGSNWEVDTRTLPRFPSDPLDGPTEVIWRPIGGDDTGPANRLAPSPSRVNGAPVHWAGAGVDLRQAAGEVTGAHPPRAVVRRRARRRQLLEWPFLVVFSLLAALVLRTFVVQTFFIPSQSMHDTLLEGDRVLVNKLAYRVHEVNRGDVIVFRRPANIDIPDNDLIKRVIGLPGDRLEGRAGQVYVNGRLLREPYVQRDCRDGTLNLRSVVIPSRHLFVMGDNRCDSTDSRVFGPIDEDLIVGRAFVLVWPTGRVGWL